MRQEALLNTTQTVLATGSGLAVLATDIRYFDLVVGAAIGAYVLREAGEIIGEARQARRSA